MSRRALRIELRRGAGLPLLAVTVVLGVAYLYADPGWWAGQWNGLAHRALRELLVLALPIAVAASAWQAGRERRRRVSDLVASTPRPRWRRLATTWAAVALGATAGMVLVWGSGAVLVAPVATYGGGSWPQIALLGLLAVAVGTAVGFGIGWLMPWRLTAPVAGALMLLASGVVWQAHEARWLYPATDLVAGAFQMPLEFVVWQVAWLAGLGVAALALAFRSRVVAAGALGLAVLGGSMLLSDQSWNDRMLPDPAAAELRCVPGPVEACTVRELAFALEGFAVGSQPVLERLDGLTGAPRRVVGAPVGLAESGGDTTYVRLTTQLTTPTARMAAWGPYPNRPLEDQVADNVVGGSLECLRASVSGWIPSGQRTATAEEAQARLRDETERAAILRAYHAALLWVAGAPADGVVSFTVSEGGRAVVRSGESPGYQVLDGWPDAEQRRWMSDYLTAVRGCDIDGVLVLAEQLA